VETAMLSIGNENISDNPVGEECLFLYYVCFNVVVSCLWFGSMISKIGLSCSRISAYMSCFIIIIGG
jgi:hypothetical protein